MKKNLLLLLLLFPFAAMSATTWIGPSTITIADWNTVSNWSSGIPTGSEQITFNTPVIIAENVPITVNNTLVIQNTLTVNNGVTFINGDVSISGGSIINNGVFSGHNLSYTNSGGSIINNDSMNLTNLNIGNSTSAGTFDNNGALSVIKDIVVEEGRFNNNTGSSSTINGITVQNGGSILNSGIINSAGAASTDRIAINAGGMITNQGNGTINVNLSQSNVYGINSQGTLINSGNINIGFSPYNPGSKGILVGSGSSFTNTLNLTFAIDPANCVITNNSGASGFFSTGPITIISGKNCLNTVLPVSLVSFNGQYTSGFNSISWVADNEMDIAKYELQRADPNSISTQWTTISTLALQSTHSYQFRDYTRLAACLYRLKMIDINGNFAYSKIIKVNDENTAKSSLLIYPSPATQTIHLTGTPLGRSFTLEIINVSGVTVKKYTSVNNLSSFELQYNIADIPAGVYQVTLADSRGTIFGRGKFVKVN